MVAYFFPPMGDGGVFRSLKLARYLPARGWTPHVLCGRPEDYWLRDDSLLDELPPDLDVTRVGGLTGQGILRRLRRGGGEGKGGGSSRSSGLFRQLRRLGDTLLLPDSYAGWIGPALRAGRKILDEGDVELIYSSSPPDSSHLVARRLAAESGLPWVADFRDPWFNLHLKQPPSPLHAAWHRRAEARVLREAQVVAVTEGWRRHYADLTARAPRLIRNGFDPADFAVVEAGADVEAGDEIHLLHTGKLSLTRSARPFFAGLALLLERRPELRRRLRVTFLGLRESDNESAAAELGLEDLVSFADPVPHAESVARQAAADILLLIKHDDPRYRDLIPGKFYEYTAAGPPILAMTPAGELESLMAEHELGWTCRLDAAAVAEGLAAAVDAVASGERKRRPAPAEFTRTAQAAAMGALFDELSPAPVRGGNSR
jgi:hypothetical protein